MMCVDRASGHIVLIGKRRPGFPKRRPPRSHLSEAKAVPAPRGRLFAEEQSVWGRLAIRRKNPHQLSPRYRAFRGMHGITMWRLGPGILRTKVRRSLGIGEGLRVVVHYDPEDLRSRDPLSKADLI